MDGSVSDTAKELFSLIDTHQKGYILKEELSLMVDDFTDLQLHSVFSALDKEGEGKITLDDFTEAFVALTNHNRQDDHENKQDTSEELPMVCTAREGSYCVKRHVGSHCDTDVNVNIKRSGYEVLDKAQSEKSLQGISITSNSRSKYGDRRQKSSGSQALEDGRTNDDVFEGEGLLHTDTQTYGSSPSRPQYLRSPSIRRSRANSAREQSTSEKKGPEITDRSPPDGNESIHCKVQRPPESSRNSVGKEGPKSPKTKICMPCSGFAKDAIVDLLKIVDAHTISNLGLYDNTKVPWQHNVKLDSSDIFGKIEHRDVDCQSFTNVYKEVCGGKCQRSQEYHSSKTEAFSHEPTEHSHSSTEACTCMEPERTSSTSGRDSSSFISDEEISRQNLFSPSSMSSDYACSLEAQSESEPTRQRDVKDSNQNLVEDCRTPFVGGDEKGCQGYQSPQRIGAKVEKDIIGNLILDNRSERHDDLYDKILSLSGVELNSRLSSSESSLHDLILEAEVVKKSAALVEDWDSVMKRINGVSIFGGNQTIRYLWQQISMYYTDLIQPFEDFLKSMVAEMQRAYTKCQELDTLLNSKAEQHERELARVYDEMEQFLAREKEQLQSEQNEREEHIRAELHRIIESKENDLLDSLRSKADLESKFEKLLEDYHTSKIGKEELEKQIVISSSSEAKLRNENDYLTQENHSLTDQLSKYIQSVNDMQDQLIKVSKIAEANKENYKSCYRKYQDAIEEREYFDMNINNLTKELEDLRNANESLQERVDTNLNTSILWKDCQVSPDLNGKRGSRMLDFPNGIMPISKSQRNSLVSEPSFDELLPDVTITHTPDLPVPDVISSRSKIVTTPPKSASTPARGNGRNTKAEKSVQEKIPVTPVLHTGQEYKVIFVGDASVGKTSLIRKIGRGTFNARRESTTSPDFLKTTVTVKNRSVTLNMWDTVGQERCSYVLKVEGFDQQLTFRFNSLPPSYFRKADVVVLVYDVIEEITFLNVKSWMKTIYEYTDENVLLVLCGNKSDLDHRRKVKEEKAANVAKINDAIYLESSAKTGFNVAKLCETIASTLLERDDTVFIREKSVKILHQDFLNIARSNVKTCC